MVGFLGFDRLPTEHNVLSSTSTHFCATPGVDGEGLSPATHSPRHFLHGGTVRDPTVLKDLLRITVDSCSLLSPL